MLEAARSLFDKRRVEPFRGARRERLLSALHLSGRHRFDEIVLGGGTLINRGYLALARCAVATGVPVIALGTGAGSSGFDEPSERLDEDWAELLSGFRRIGVRGPRTQAKLADLGIADVQVTGDLCLALTRDRPRSPRARRRYLLNVAHQSGNSDASTRRLTSELARACLRLDCLGWTAVPVAFSSGDAAAISQVLRLARIDTRPIVQPQSSVTFFELADEASFMIGVRLHAAVLSCCAGVAPLAIAYRDKGWDFAATMGLEPWTLDAAALHCGDLAARAEALASEADQLGEHLRQKALHWRDNLRAFAAHA